MKQTITLLFTLLLLSFLPTYSQIPTGGYTFRSVATGKLLGANEAGFYLSPRDRTSYQNWLVQRTDVQVQGRATYSIRNGNTTKALEVKADQVVLATFGGLTSQTWKLEPTGEPDTYWITSMINDKQLDANESQVYLMSRNGGNYQKWWMEKTGTAQTQTSRVEAPPATEKRIRKGTYMLLQKGAYSPNRQYQLALLNDGNLFLYSYLNGDRKAIWSTNTANRQVKYGLFQDDGNFVLYDINDKAVWASGTDGRGAYLSIQNDGNVVIYDNAEKPIWATNTQGSNTARIEAPPATSDPRMVHRSFRRNMTFARGSNMDSKDGRFQLAFQDDGNMVLYRLAGGRKSIWASNTNGKAVKEYKFQDDGNLVIYGYNDKPIWASNTDGRGEYMLLQNDGNLVIYDSRNKPIWATNTSQ
ncbi:hypothetical protein GCM10028807_47100 [Spirosoma daeguense]